MAYITDKQRVKRLKLTRYRGRTRGVMGEVEFTEWIVPHIFTRVYWHMRRGERGSFSSFHSQRLHHVYNSHFTTIVQFKTLQFYGKRTLFKIKVVVRERLIVFLTTA